MPNWRYASRTVRSYDQLAITKFLKCLSPSFSLSFSLPLSLLFLLIDPPAFGMKFWAIEQAHGTSINCAWLTPPSRDPRLIHQATSMWRSSRGSAEEAVTINLNKLLTNVNKHKFSCAAKQSQSQRQRQTKPNGQLDQARTTGNRNAGCLSAMHCVNQKCTKWQAEKGESEREGEERERGGNQLRLFDCCLSHCQSHVWRLGD